ncbi:hypothetical protein [Pseudomonas monachiensis]|uniref:Uncharacterized protein n=1 Tax=Pseudomonas monachiensis TaxID=3060212 RepID=A0ABW9H5K2_9PSED
MEYCIPLDYPFAFDLPALFVTMIGSELPIASGGDRQKSADSVEKKSAMVSAAEKHASEIEIITFERGCWTQISRGGVLKRRFHRSLSWPFQKTDFFNTVGQ